MAGADVWLWVEGRAIMRRLRVFIASPADVDEEREHVEQAIRDISLVFSEELGLHLEPVRWETHVDPGVGVDAQSVVNEAIGDGYEVFIGVLWTRFGTPTARADSGTEEEFLRTYERWKADPNSVSIMWYFKDADVSPTSLDLEQLAKVRAFRNRIMEEMGILAWSFRDLPELDRFLRIHLSRVALHWKRRDQDGGSIEEAFPPPGNSDQDAPTPESPASTDADAEEVGLLELIERTRLLFANIHAQLKSVSTATGQAFDSLSRTTGHLQESFKATDVEVPRAISRVLTQVLNEFSTLAERDAELLGKHFGDAVDTVSRTTSAYREFQGTELIERFVQSMQTMERSLQACNEPLARLELTIEGVPRLTTQLISARRRSLTVLSALQRELYSALVLMAEARKLVSEFTVADAANVFREHMDEIVRACQLAPSNWQVMAEVQYVGHEFFVAPTPARFTLPTVESAPDDPLLPAAWSVRFEPGSDRAAIASAIDSWEQSPGEKTAISVLPGNVAKLEEWLHSPPRDSYGPFS
jgi:hypothetical protein